MTDECVWKEAVVAQSRYYPGTCPEGLRKRMKHLSQDSRCPGRDSKQAPLKHMSKALLLD
jgi:hypothetical protein